MLLAACRRTKTGWFLGAETERFLQVLLPKRLKMEKTQRLTTGFPVVGALRLGAAAKQAMKAFQIESETNQAPLATDRCQAAQGKLTEAKYLFNGANNGFDGRFS